MAIASVAMHPDAYGADPVHGNFTSDAHEHLWCANALAIALSTPERAIEELNDDIQAALRYLLSREVARAMKAEAAEGVARRQRYEAQAVKAS